MRKYSKFSVDDGQRNEEMMFESHFMHTSNWVLLSGANGLKRIIDGLVFYYLRPMHTIILFIFIFWQNVEKLTKIEFKL